MERRNFIKLVVGTAIWPLPTHAQQAGRIHRIGFLRVGEPPPSFVEGFRLGLREQGLIEDQNAFIEWGLPLKTN